MTTETKTELEAELNQINRLLTNALIQLDEPYQEHNVDNARKSIHQAKIELYRITTEVL